MKMSRFGTLLTINALEGFVMGTTGPSKDFRHWQTRCCGINFYRPVPESECAGLKGELTVSRTGEFGYSAQEGWGCKSLPGFYGLDKFPGKISHLHYLMQRHRLSPNHSCWEAGRLFWRSITLALSLRLPEKGCRPGDFWPAILVLR